MAFLMTDVAAGSTAARNLQQNIYGAQYDEANIAADAEQKQLKLQQDRIKTMYAPEETQIKLEQDKLGNEKTRLANTVAETGFNASKDAKTRFEALATTEDYQKADPVRKLQMMASSEMETGRVEEGAKLLAGAEALEIKDVQTKLKQQESNALIIGNAYAAVKNATPEQFTKLVSRFPEEQLKAIEAQIPGWSKQTDTKLQKAQLEALMENTSGKNLMSTNQTRLQVAEINKVIQAAHDAAKTSIAQSKNATGGTPEELKQYNAYNRATYRIDASFRKPLQEAFDAFKKAAEEDSKGTYGIFNWAGGGPSLAKEAENKPKKQKELNSTKAWQAWRDLKEESIREKLDTVEGLPEGKEKNRLFKILTQQLESIQVDIPDLSAPAKLTQEQNDAAITKANEAVKNGADPEKVKARLKEAGVLFKE
jgi:hypothetical protein